MSHERRTVRIALPSSLSALTKLVGAVTALLVALTGLWLAVMGDDAPPAPLGVTVVLDSPEAFAHFIENHPSNG
jgi:hypothetical protein